MISRRQHPETPALADGAVRFKYFRVSSRRSAACTGTKPRTFPKSGARTRRAACPSHAGPAPMQDEILKTGEACTCRLQTCVSSHGCITDPRICDSMAPHRHLHACPGRRSTCSLPCDTAGSVHSAIMIYPITRRWIPSGGPERTVRVPKPLPRIPRCLNRMICRLGAAPAHRLGRNESDFTELPARVAILEAAGPGQCRPGKLQGMASRLRPKRVSACTHCRSAAGKAEWQRINTSVRPRPHLRSGADRLDSSASTAGPAGCKPGRLRSRHGFFSLLIAAYAGLRPEMIIHITLLPPAGFHGCPAPPAFGHGTRYRGAGLIRMPYLCRRVRPSIMQDGFRTRCGVLQYPS